MTTPADLITTARYIYNDADSTLYRKTDTELLGYVNEGMMEISQLQPSIFYTIGDLTCTAGEVEQVVTFVDAQVMMEVLCIHGGAAVLPTDMTTLDAFLPNWRGATAAPATGWMKKPGDPLRFFIYPPAPVAQVLDVLYVRNPTGLALADTITEVSAGYMPALADYIIYRAESADDEHSNSGRATAHYQAFVAKVKGAGQ